MNDFLRYSAIALVLLVGIVVLAVCGEGLCSLCEHMACAPSDRSKPLLSLVRRVCGALASAISIAVLPLALQVRGLSMAFRSDPPPLALLQVSPLRI